MTHESLPAAAVNVHDGRVLHGQNVKRFMAQRNLTLAQVVDATTLDERTLRSILRGTTRPHARTLHKLAAGLGIEIHELFQDPRECCSSFDRATNPAVAQVMAEYPELFEKWTAADFEELFSRVAVGGEMTEEGALAAAGAMNRRRDLMTKVAVILETAEAELLRELVSFLYRRATTLPE